MIDNIKFKISTIDKLRFEESIEKNELISLRSTFDRQTGEANDYPKVGRLQNMEIRITKKAAIVKGSIHKYYNLMKGLGNQNYNDFSFKQFKLAIDDLCEKLQLDKKETKITNLEFGFNITVSKNPKLLLDEHILMFDLKDHNRKHNYKGNGSYKEFERTDYKIKIYDKGKQYSILDRNLLRVELKIIASRYLNRLGIINLNQLGNYAFKSLFEAFLTHLNKLTIVDSLKAPEDIRIDQRILFDYCINPNHWSRIGTQEKKETLRELKKLIKKYHLNKTHCVLRDDIITKYLFLMDIKS
ncbi:hypothetical protein [Mangrovimonas futianensis]|uniref:hypothetical protein n=1 Tax=Mangrovimonas futianensis TaxID=2895523 RepID=UPI001E3CD7F5|nr:hypothetical protein [Mangrovimonas futianensis]MCF1420443.1 hypothetical protein [Mangrovimonas futianensis]